MSEIVTKVREIAAAHPDRVYTSPEGADGCVYVHAGAPSCILGHAMWQLGIIDAAFEELNKNGYQFSEIYSQSVEFGHLPERDIRWLIEVQIAQDAGNPWGESIEIADSEMAR